MAKKKKVKEITVREALGEPIYKVPFSESWKNILELRRYTTQEGSPGTGMSAADMKRA